MYDNLGYSFYLLGCLLLIATAVSADAYIKEILKLSQRSRCQQNTEFSTAFCCMVFLRSRVSTLIVWYFEFDGTSVLERHLYGNESICSAEGYTVGDLHWRRQPPGLSQPGLLEAFSAFFARAPKISPFIFSLFWKLQVYQVYKLTLNLKLNICIQV